MEKKGITQFLGFAASLCSVDSLNTASHNEVYDGGPVSFDRRCGQDIVQLERSGIWSFQAVELPVVNGVMDQAFKGVRFTSRRSPK